MGKPSPRECLAAALEAAAPRFPCRLGGIAKAAGVCTRIIANAAQARPVATVPYLRICAAIGHDPLPELACPYAEPAPFDATLFAIGFRIARGLCGHSTRQAGEIIGCSAATICRLENAEVISIGVVLRACRYMQRSPWAYCVSASPARKIFDGDVSHGTLEDTMA